MAFERARIEVKQASVGTGIKVGLSKMRGAAAKMRISISRAVAIELGLRDGDGLEILMGTGEHHGLIRFRKNNSVGDAVVKFRKVVGGKEYVQISLGHQAAYVDRVEAARWCQWEKLGDDEGGYIEVVLPKWSDETGPKKAATTPGQSNVVVRPTTISAQPGAAPVKRAAVTANLMGDPPPGRREMLAKVGTL